MDDNRLRNGIIISVTVVVAVAMVALILILRASNERTIHASTRFATAVIELEFDNQSLANASEKISSIHELAPGKVRKHKLNASDRRALEAAYAQRGGEPGNLLPTTSPVKAVRFAKPAVDEHLRCIQRAHGDVNKMLRCE